MAALPAMVDVQDLPQLTVLEGGGKAVSASTKTDEYAIIFNDISEKIRKGEIPVVEVEPRSRKDPLRYPKKAIKEALGIFMVHGEIDSSTAASVWMIVNGMDSDRMIGVACEEVEAAANKYQVSQNPNPESEIDRLGGYIFLANQLGNLTALGVVSEYDGEYILQYACPQEVEVDLPEVYRMYIHSYAKLHAAVQ